MKASLIFICAICGSAFAAPRSSANYSIPIESLDPAGARTQSANYKIDASAGGIAGISTVASPSETLKHGYAGQLYDIVALSVTAPPSENLNEASSRQLQAAPKADDGTTLAPFNPSTVAWSIVSGPVASISSGGLASAATVYQNTPAAIGGSAQGLSGQFNLTVLNVGFDDYQAYAGDGIDDDWQVQYFGLPPNLNAGPNADPDGDGQNNRFEFTAGLIPTNANSFFRLRIESVAGQPAQKRLIFSPRFVDRTYTPQFRTDLLPGSWNPLAGTTQNDIAQERTLTDLNGIGAAKFYRVQISKP